MKSNIFINAQELADELGVSKGKAYKMIQSWNERLEQMGYTTVRGRVSRKYYLEQMPPTSVRWCWTSTPRTSSTTAATILQSNSMPTPTRLQ